MNHRSTDEIRKDIHHTEFEISETLHSIEEKISPENLKRKAMERIRAAVTSGRETTRTFMKEKPAVPAAAAGLAVLLAAFTARKRKKTAMPVKTGGTGKSVAIGFFGLAIGAALAAMMPAAVSAAGTSRKPSPNPAVPSPGPLMETSPTRMNAPLIK